MTADLDAGVNDVSPSGIVVDLDGTLALPSPTGRYEDCPVNAPLLARLRTLRAHGSRIVIATARNMRTYGANVGLINANTVPVILDWLERHEVPYDELHVGKPWPGPTGYYVDDRAIRPSELVSLDDQEIAALLERER